MPELLSEVRSNDNDCLHDNFDVEDQDNACSPFSGVGIVELDNYPGCTFELEFTYFKCSFQNNLPNTIYIDNYQLISYNCPQYEIDLLNAQSNGTLDQFSKDIDKRLLLALSFFIVKPLTPIFSGASFHYYYYHAACTNYCYQIISRGGATYYLFDRVICGPNCCLSELVYDSDPNTGDWEFGYASSDPIIPGEDCDASSIVHSCPVHSVFSSDCTVTCDWF